MKTLSFRGPYNPDTSVFSKLLFFCDVETIFSCSQFPIAQLENLAFKKRIQKQNMLKHSDGI